MENTSSEQINKIVESQRVFFKTGTTLSYEYRCRQLKCLAQALEKWMEPLYDALWKDLHKSKEETFLTEISIVKGEIKNHLKHLRTWMKPQRKYTPLKMMPSHSRLMNEPLGNALIVAPWNYPVQLLLNPLVGAISSGCTALLKPSPYVPNVSKVIEQLVSSSFEKNYIAVVQGNREVNKFLFEQRFDIIFFTGSPTLGKQVMAAAAQHLTPVVLELGGKSPCIVDKSANVKVAAKRIAWGKTLNAGQTCIAPDYLLIHSSLKESFIIAYKEALQELHGNNIQESRHFVRIVSDSAFARIAGYLQEGRIVLGGNTNATDRYIEPTLLDNVSAESAVMREEIFGPILPMMTFDHLEEVASFVSKREKPLAFYYFGNTRDGKSLIHHTTSGGACINDTIMHIVNEHLPFGGVGNSGMGQYHGRESFEAFSNRRAVVITPTKLDLPFRYMPYKRFRFIKKML